MGISSFFQFKKNKKVEEPIRVGDSFISNLLYIKEGDQQLREEFIIKYKPFIISVIVSAIGRKQDLEYSDEFSIALEAFNEAIDKYDTSRKSSFILFAEQRIKWKLNDYRKKENIKRNKEYPFSYFEDEMGIGFEERHLVVNGLNEFEDVESCEEIMQFEKRLSNFDISILDLVENSPKHKDTLSLCVTLARVLATDDLLYSKLLKNKNIPRNELIGRVNVHRRTIENHRKLIIGFCLIFRSELENSKLCLINIEKEEEFHG